MTRLDQASQAFIDSMLAYKHQIEVLEAKAIKFDIPNYAEIPIEELEKRVAYFERRESQPAESF